MNVKTEVRIPRYDNRNQQQNGDLLLSSKDRGIYRLVCIEIRDDVNQTICLAHVSIVDLRDALNRYECKNNR